MATQRLAEWITDFEKCSVPQSVTDAAVRSFQNSFGCILGGSTHATTHRATQALRPTFGKATCSIFGQRLKQDDGGDFLLCDMQNAALINGIASHVHDYDDTHLHTVIHPAGAVVVSLLAFSEHLKESEGTTVSGQDFLKALIVGIEVGLRVGNAVSPKHYSEGWHITGTVSPIAAAAALSSLLGLSHEQTSNALGIASTQLVGVRVHFGTDTKPFHVGAAAQNGILAVVLARGGFTAAKDALEGRRGWVEVLGNGSDTLKEQVDELIDVSSEKGAGQGRRLWEIEKNTFKPFPCGIVIHPTIDACIQIKEQRKFAPDSIKAVHLLVHPLVLDLTGKKAPKDGLEAKFSVYHGAAIGLALGSATPKEYTDQTVNDSNVLQVRDLVQAEVDEGLRSDEVVVTVDIADGSQVKKHVEHAIGSLDRPMTNDELKQKFLAQVVPVLGQKQAEEIEGTAWKIGDLEDITMIAQTAR